MNAHEFTIRKLRQGIRKKKTKRRAGCANRAEEERRSKAGWAKRVKEGEWRAGFAKRASELRASSFELILLL